MKEFEIKTNSDIIIFEFYVVDIVKYSEIYVLILTKSAF